MTGDCGSWRARRPQPVRSSAPQLLRAAAGDPRADLGHGRGRPDRRARPPSASYALLRMLPGPGRRALRRRPARARSATSSRRAAATDRGCGRRCSRSGPAAPLLGMPLWLVALRCSPTLFFPGTPWPDRGRGATVPTQLVLTRRQDVAAGAAGPARRRPGHRGRGAGVPALLPGAAAAGVHGIAAHRHRPGLGGPRWSRSRRGAGSRRLRLAAPRPAARRTAGGVGRTATWPARSPPTASAARSAD